MADKGIIITPKPGQRDPECEIYKMCLDTAAFENVKEFNCERCPRYIAKRGVPIESSSGSVPEGQETGRKLKSESSKLKGRKKKETGGKDKGERRKVKGRETRKTGDGRQETEPGTQTPAAGCMVNLDEHPDLLLELQECAADEMRKIIPQALYFIREGIRRWRAGR